MGSPQAKFARVAEGLYRFEKNGTASGPYYAYFWRGGKQIKQRLEGIDREQAKRELAALRNEDERTDPSKRKMTVGDLLDRYLVTIGDKALQTQRTRTSFVKRIRSHWPGGSGQLVRDVTPDALQTFIAAESKRVSKTTLNEYRRVLRHAFKVAVGARVISTSPAAELKGQRPDRPIRTTPTQEEFQAIVAQIRGQKFSDTARAAADLIEFMGLAGLGNAEVAALEWKHIDFAKGRITLLRQKTTTGFQIPIYPQLRPLLERLHGARKDESRVFKIGGAKKALSTACKKLGLPSYSHRSFRRLFCTNAIERGIDFKTVAGWQGHRDGGALVAKTYSHLRTEHSDAQAAKMV